MANTVKIRRSGTTTSTPSSLDHGELAINYADDTLFWKDDANVIQSFVFQAYASATHKSSHATGGSDALTPSDIGAAPAASPTFTGTVTVPGLTSTGVILADDDATENSVVYSFDGDPDTGIGRNGADIVTVVTAGSERVRVDSSGRVGIGTSPTAADGIRLGRALTGGTTVYGVHAAQNVLSDATANAGVFRTSVGTEAASFTLPGLYHFSATQTTFGAGSTVSAQYGFYVAGNLVGATTNYGFRSDIADGSGRWNFFAGGLAPNYFAGNVGIGATPASRLHVNGVITVSATAGSAGSYLPSVTFSGDSNTGLGQVGGADSVSLITAGSERVRVDASGNIEAGPNKRAILVSSRLHVSADNANWGVPLAAVCDSVGRGPVFVSADYSPNPDVGSQLYFNASTGGFTIGCTSPGNSALGSVTFASSQIVTPAGTAAAPAIVSGTGTSDSGIFWPAADTVAISTAGSERLRVDSSGRVGIGTSPTSSASGQSALDVNGPLVARGRVVAHQTGAAVLEINDNVCQLRAYGPTAGSGVLDLRTGGGGGSADARAVRIDESQRVGIGTGTAALTALLDINSDKIRLRTAKTPASASDTGNAGDICWDASYLYICTATNTWRRIAHDTW